MIARARFRAALPSRARAAGFSPAPRHSLAAFSHTGGSAAKARGFTLIEIILATVLLALGLTIAFASLHSANASVQRAELAASRNEHLRAVHTADAKGRGPARRSLVVGVGSAEGVRHPLRDRDGRARARAARADRRRR